MTSKGAKETIVSKLGFKSSSSASKAEAELERIRKENSHLRKKIDDLTKRHIRPPDSDKSKLLERILSLETLRERNNQQLLVKEQELETLRQQLTAKGGEVVASLQAQLEQRRKDVEQRDALFQNLAQETENLKNKLTTVSARCQSLETQTPPADLVLLQDQLKDALEKNQQWLVYDQQREAYVQSMVARTLELDKQLAEAKQQQSKAEENSGTSTNTPDAEKKSEANQLLIAAQKDLESQKKLTAKTQLELQKQKEQTLKAQAEQQSQKEQVAQLLEKMTQLQRKYEDKSRELSAFHRKYEEKSKELEETRMKLQSERVGNRHAADEERKSSEQRDRMRLELECVNSRLEEERKKSAELLVQVNMLQKSLLGQNEEHRRISALEQQIQQSAKESENEKMDRQSMQQQLLRVQKELRQARDQIAKLESAKQPSARFSEPSSYSNFDLEHLSLGDRHNTPTSPSKVINLLDESFLECPKCHAHYPTSRHRELLAHIDYCLA